MPSRRTNSPDVNNVWLTNQKYDEMCREIALLDEARAIIYSLSRVENDDLFGFWAVREKADEFNMLHGAGDVRPLGVIKAGRER